MNLDDFSMDDWKATELEYFEKVIMQNEYILSTTVLQHHFTDDSSEVLFITSFSSWNNIDLATQRTNELVEKTWPNPEDRRAFLNKQAMFYANEHSDDQDKSNAIAGFCAGTRDQHERKVTEYGGACCH